VSERTITTTDGRGLHLHEAGERGGRPVIVVYGTPSSGLVYARHAADAEARGIHLIAFDRPGYGESDTQPGRTVADVAADVTAIADELGLGRFAVWGVSGGGPHALACAALLPDRVAAVASLAAPAPYPAEGLDWLAGMGEDNVEEFGATLEGRAALEPILRRHAVWIEEATVDDIREQWASLLTDLDAGVVDGDQARYMLESMRRAIAPGIEGWRDDDLAFVRPWGFELEQIRVPVLLWHGEHDRFVPIAHGRWLAERIPGVEARFRDDDGHLTLVEHRVPEVHAWLLERL
jgi:pimeloyl-ACP methyl ester carboxylesterase